MAIEETMSQLAHSQITQSLPSLADSVQGFQIVINDEDNNLVIGVIVALLGDTCIYIPAIYKDGKIYSMDIMYVPEMQQWLPTQDNWVSYLRSHKAGLIDSMGVDKQNVGSGAGSVNLDISFNKLVKSASAQITNIDLLKGMPKLLKAASESLSFQLTQPVGDFDIPSFPEAMSKCAAQDAATILNTVAEYPTVSNGFVQFYTDKDMIDIATKVAENNVKLKTKQKADREPAKGVRVLTVSSAEAKNLDHDAKVKLLSDGAVIIDERGLTPSKIYKTKSNADWATATDYGMYELLKVDGSTMTALVIPTSDPKTPYECKPLGADSVTNSHRTIVIPLEDFKAKAAYTVSNPPLGQRYPVEAPEITTALDLSDLYAKMQRKDTTGSVEDSVDDGYYLITSGNDAACIGRIPSYGVTASWVGDADGTSALVLSRSLDCNIVAGRDSTSKAAQAAHRYACRELRINRVEELPDGARIRVRGSILYVPQNAKVFPLIENDKSDAELQLAGVDEFCIAQHNRDAFTKLKLFNDNNRITISVDDGKVTEPLGKTNAELQLVKDYIISPGEAAEMVKEASMAPDHQCRYLVKVAAESAYASMLGEQLATEDDYESVNLNTVLPEDARRDLEVAATSGIKDVVDVSILKTLANSRSSVGKIQEFVPRLFTAMDAVCRLLFMVRAGTAMEEAYGTTRSKELEEQLSQLVGELGDVIICLQQGRIDSVNNLLEGPLSDSLG